MEMHFELSTYVDGLSPAEQDRVLTSRLGPGGFLWPDGCRCLVGAVRDYRTNQDVYDDSGIRSDMEQPHIHASYQFEVACSAYGPSVVIEAIRQRILDNQLRRELANVEQPGLVRASL